MSPRLEMRGREGNALFKKRNSAPLFALFSMSAIFFLVVFSLISCAKQPSFKIPELPNLTHTQTILGEYAKEFRIDEYAAENPVISTETEKSMPFGFVQGDISFAPDAPVSPYKLLTISDSERYLLVPKNAPVPEPLPPDIVLIRSPVKNAYLCASSAMALWSAIDSLSSIRFSAIQKKDWYIEEAVRAMENDAIQYAGKYNAPDFELLLSEKCSLAIESTMIYHAPQIKEKLESLGIPVFVDKSSYEENPLGRMEWIKVYGALLGKESEAESFFAAQIEKIGKRNENVSDKNQHNKTSPKVAFFYITPNGLVVIRGSGDYIVKMIEMAGGEYAFPKTRKSTSPSVTISMEEFYAQCANADILIYNSSIDNSVRTLSDLLEKSPLFAEFEAVKNGSVWTTGKYLYQATDRIGDMILDMNEIITGKDGKLAFLEKVE